MQTIELSTVPNQIFTTTLDGDRYEISIIQTGGCMACNVSRNETVVVSGMRITSGEFLIPFFCYQALSGNFILLTQNNELPDYTLFGSSQTLVYMTAAEMASAVGGTLP